MDGYFLFLQFLVQTVTAQQETVEIFQPHQLHFEVQVFRATDRRNGREVSLEENFSDFREVDGLVFPFHIETHLTDRPEAITITVEKVELNPEIDDSRFRFPD